MQVQLNQELKNLSGELIKSPWNQDENLTVGKTIAHILGSTQAKNVDSFKVYELAKLCYTTNEYDFLGADIDLIKDIIKEDKQFTHIIKGQLLEILK